MHAASAVPWPIHRPVKLLLAKLQETVSDSPQGRLLCGWLTDGRARPALSAFEVGGKGTQLFVTSYRVGSRRAALPPPTDRSIDGRASRSGLVFRCVHGLGFLSVDAQHCQWCAAHRSAVLRQYSTYISACSREEKQSNAVHIRYMSGPARKRLS